MLQTVCSNTALTAVAAAAAAAVDGDLLQLTSICQVTSAERSLHVNLRCPSDFTCHARVCHRPDGAQICEHVNQHYLRLTLLCPQSMRDADYQSIMACIAAS